MLKLLFVFLLSYFLVKAFLRIFAPQGRLDKDRMRVRKRKKSRSPYEQKGKYIDYQEVKPKPKT